MLLRPGGISRHQIEAVIGTIERQSEADTEAHPSPGMHPRHYSPRTKVLLVRDGVVPEQGSGAYLQLSIPPQRGVQRLVQMPADSREYATRLYGTLHQLDGEHLDWIAVEIPNDAPDWEAVFDRLLRAAAPEADIPR